MTKINEIIIERGFCYSIYLSEGRYYLDTGRAIIPSFRTLEGAVESAYYQGLRDSKD